MRSCLKFFILPSCFCLFKWLYHTPKQNTAANNSKSFKPTILGVFSSLFQKAIRADLDPHQGWTGTRIPICPGPFPWPYPAWRVTRDPELWMDRGVDLTWRSQKRVTVLSCCSWCSSLAQVALPPSHPEKCHVSHVPDCSSLQSRKAALKILPTLSLESYAPFCFVFR